MTYGNFKGLNRRIDDDKILRDIGKNSKYDESQRGLTSIVYEVFDNKNQNCQLA